MMREILFRGKCADTGKWYEGQYIHSHKTTYCFEADYDNDKDDDIHQIVFEKMTDWGLPERHLQIDVIPETVGQYTGLKDKNDKKIFEGDILNVRSYDYNYEYSTKVFYNSHTLCVDVYGQDYDYTAIGFADDIWDDENCEIEIIGNIHDNPELLKGDMDNDL